MSDVGQAVYRSAVDVGRIGLRPSGQLYDESGGVVPDEPETQGKVPDAQSGQPEQRATSRKPTAKLDAARLDELTITVMECQAHQRMGRLLGDARIRKRGIQHGQRVTVIGSRRILEDPPVICHTGHPMRPPRVTDPTVVSGALVKL